MKADYSVEIKTKPLTDQEHYEADVHLKLNDEGYALDSVAMRAAQVRYKVC